VEPTQQIVGVGRPVTRVLLRTDVPVEQRQGAQELFQFEVGQPLDVDSIRRTLLNVHGSGIVSQAEIRTRLDGDGVELTLVAWSNVLVSSLEFEGETKLGRDDLRDHVSIAVGRPLIESRVMRSVFDLQDRLEDDGYLEGSVRADVELLPGGKSAAVAFHIAPGPRSTIGSIEFEGDLEPLQPEQLRQALTFAVGDRYWPLRVRRDRDKLQRHLLAQGYRMARVSRPVQVYDRDSHEMHLTYAVELGPLVELEAIGSDLKALRQAGVLPFLGPQGYDPALLGYSEVQVRSWYQAKGHLKADVSLVVASESEELVELVLTVDPGPVFTLRKVTFEGNESIADEELRLRMTTRERRVLDAGSGRVVDATLSEDLRALRSFYLLRGFHDVVVGPHVLNETGLDLALTIPIEEGEQRSIGRIDWDGVASLEIGDLEASLPIRPGGPHHPNLVEQSVNLLRATYRDEGFDNVLASATVDWDERRRVADVTFHLLEGPQTIVRRIIVRGQQQTSAWLLRRAIDLEVGGPVSRRQLLDIQRRLHSLGVFTEVDVSLAQGSLLTGERDVVIHLQEGERHRLSLGGGYDSEDGFRGLFGYSLGNMLGRAASLNLDTVVGEREELYRLLVRQPSVAAWRFPLTYSVFYTREEEIAYDKSFDGDFIITQQGAQIEATLSLDRYRMPVIYTLKKVENNAPAELDEILFDRERSRVRISSLTTALQIDRRNSVVNPTEGRNTILQAEYAFPAFGADEDFLKLFAQQTYYWNFNRAGVIGTSLRVGGIESFRSSGPIEVQPVRECSADPIPDFGVALSERFFAGGRSTHRAYKLDTLGILGETLFRNREDVDGECVDRGLFPTGGNGLALFNLEYRYPLFTEFWATTFYDTGNVWPDWRDITLADFKDGVGVGVGWDSPIGPLRLEIGWKLDREEGEDPYRIFFSFGTAF
jgi:outer membrane protein insertion porin family